MSAGRGNTFFIHTFGCQMNQADSGIITALLQAEGFVQADQELDAGIVLLNTCAVRENAVDRVEHFLQRLQGRKKREKDLIVGVAGCIPQYKREEMFSLLSLIHI